MIQVKNKWWFFGWFGVAFLPWSSEKDDVFCYVRFAPKWYWFLQRVRLFLSIVGRRYEKNRIDIPTAWSASLCAIGVTLKRRGLR